MITTHVPRYLDWPSAGVKVVLERGGKASDWQLVGHGETDSEGRLRTLTVEGAPLEPGLYRLVFDTRRYFEVRKVRAFFPSVIVMFEVAGEPSSSQAHYHVPLLLSPFGYSTYRGS